MASNGGDVNLLPASDAPFGNEEAFMDFLGQNEISHQGIADALARNLGSTVAPLPTVDGPSVSEDWLNDHWQRHISECLPLGIIVPDLSSVDLKNENEYLDWMSLHGALHVLQNAALGIIS